MFYYQDFRAECERIKTKLKEANEFEEIDDLVDYELRELLDQMLGYIEKKPKNKEKFYRRLLNELCDNFPGLMWGEDEDDDFTETLYLWKYGNMGQSGSTSYEELAKDIMKHLKIEE